MATVLASMWLGVLMSSAGLSSAAKQAPSMLIITVNVLFTLMAIGLLIKIRKEKQDSPQSGNDSGGTQQVEQVRVEMTSGPDLHSVLTLDSGLTTTCTL